MIRVFIPSPDVLDLRLHGQYETDTLKHRVRPVTFFDWLEENVFVDRNHLGKKTSEIEEATKTLMAFKDKKAGDFVDIEGGIHGRLLRVIDEGPDSAGWSPWYHRQFVGFFDAFRQAKEAPPAPPPAVDA